MVYTWLKVQNELRKPWCLFRVQINSANCSHFLTIFWHFLPTNLCKCFPNHLKFAEKVALQEIHELCKNHGHWVIFGQVELFQIAFFGSFYPLTSVSGVQMTWSFQRSYFLMRFAWYNFCTCGMPWKKWFFWIFFSIFKSNLPFEDDIKQKSDRKLKLFPADFKCLIGFALVLWENVQTDALFPGC